MKWIHIALGTTAMMYLQDRPVDFPKVAWSISHSFSAEGINTYLLESDF